MTTSPSHVVVDGSNIATEGRSLPSLKQLSDAVMSFMEEHPDAAVTVVVDATFGHRIDKKEQKEFEEGIANNELVAPPAGAIGRGDAFVLSIADKANATVLSNDSFQEFHADYDWLFDEGRLIGGKPVPHVGWVFVARSPVRGPVSRKVTRAAGRGGSRRGRSRKDEGTVRQGSAEASQPMPVPKSPPPSAKRTAKKSDRKSEKKSDGGRGAQAAAARPAPSGSEPVNELLPFLEFVEHHPVGTSVNGTVDSYSSHGAYITIGDEGVRGYVPLRMMADPAPRSAKSIMKIGESITVVVVNFSGARRSIDCALPDMADAAIAAAAAESDDAPAAEPAPATKAAPKKKAATKKTAAKKTAAKKAPAKKTAAKKSPAKKAATKKTVTKKTPAKKTAAKKTSTKQAAAKKSAAKKPAAKKPAAKKAPAKKSAAKKSAAKKAPAKRSATKKAPAKKSTASRSGGSRGVERVPATPTPIKQSVARNES